MLITAIVAVSFDDMLKTVQDLVDRDKRMFTLSIAPNSMHLNVPISMDSPKSFKMFITPNGVASEQCIIFYDGTKDHIKDTLLNIDQGAWKRLNYMHEV